MMLKLLLLAHLGLLLQLASGQSVIDYSKVPSCAHQCSILAQAEANCVPPAAPVTEQAIYQSCVCQSTLLVGLHSSGAQCQQTGCSADDAQKISQYYIALCNGPVVQPAATTTTATATKSTSTTSTSTSTSKADGAGVITGLSSNKKGDDYWSTHWKWVLMAIIICVAIVVSWMGGIWLRRRHDRKKDAQRANLAATDGPVNASSPGLTTPASASKTTVSQSVTPAPTQMTMSGANGMNMDGGVGGIAPPRGVPFMRSRSGTLQSLRAGNSSRTTLPSEPVVWGPHQHFAHANGSPGGSVPPSPTFPPPTGGASDVHPVFRNHEALRSEPRIGENGHATGPARPNTAQPTRHLWHPGPARSLSAVRSDPVLTPHYEGQVAEIADPSPQKSPNRLRK